MSDLEPTNSVSMTTPPSKTQKVLIFGLVLFAYFLIWCCVALWAPFFPGEAAKRGVTSTEVGFIFGIYSLVSFLFSLIFGAFVIPKVGPKFVILIGLVVNGGSYIICGFAYLIQDRVQFSVFCFILRSIAAVGGTASKTASMVILIQEFPNNVLLTFSMLEIATGMGMSLGPVLGGFFYSIGGFRLPMFVIGGLLFIYLPLIWLVLPSEKNFIPKEHHDRCKLIKNTIKVPGVIAMCNADFLCLFAFTFIDPILQNHAATFGLDSKGVSMLFLCLSCCYMLACVVVGFIINRKRDAFSRISIVIGLFGMAVSILFLGPASFLTSFVPPRKLWVLVPALAILGASDGMSFIPVLPHMLQCCEEAGIEKSLELDSLISGLASGFTSLGSFLGPVIGGALNDYFGFPWTATIISLFLAVQAVLTGVFFICSKRKDSEYEPVTQDNKDYE